MRLIFKQKLFSWFDSYDIYDEMGNTVFTVKGKLSWGHCFNIYDRNGNHIGTVKERLLTLLPKFEIYINNNHAGSIQRDFAFFKAKYNIDFLGWNVTGNFWEWDYQIVNNHGYTIANISKQLFKLTDTYIIDVANPNDALCALMLVIAIDAEKCSRNNSN
ncbi:MAG: LURP-one-related family protein [Acutalibacteraceae bacterium]|nr:LURP-one-related family protein [Acutalibacteraceae bacterium]